MFILCFNPYMSLYPFWFIYATHSYRNPENMVSLPKCQIWESAKSIHNVFIKINKRAMHNTQVNHFSKYSPCYSIHLVQHCTGWYVYVVRKLFLIGQQAICTLLPSTHCCWQNYHFLKRLQRVETDENPME
jgi:hypothetical protein